MSQKNTRETIASLAVLIVIVVIIGVAAATNSNKQKMPTKTDTSNKVQISSTPAAAGSTYKNGTFSDTASYDSPGGPEDFTLKVTIKDDVIADTSAESGSKDFTSRSYQQQFIAAYKQLVVGKKVDSVGSLGAVAGSSLTGQGFTKALEKIKQEAKA